jgi:lipid A disaccharide synthetase
MSRTVLISICVFAGSFVFSQTPIHGQVAKEKGPLVKKLEKRVTLEFKRTPLRTAIAEIAKGSGTKIDIDRNSLKAEGLTQNISQTFSFKNQAARTCLHQILKQYSPLVLCIDRTGLRFLVTTKRAARQQKLKTVKLD